MSEWTIATLSVSQYQSGCESVAIILCNSTARGYAAKFCYEEKNIGMPLYVLTVIFGTNMFISTTPQKTVTYAVGNASEVDIERICFDIDRKKACV